MKNKLLIQLVVPSLDLVYDIFVPANKRVGNVIQLISKALNEMTNGSFIGNDNTSLYCGETGQKLHPNSLVRETTIKNGSRIVLF